MLEKSSKLFINFLLTNRTLYELLLQNSGHNTDSLYPYILSSSTLKSMLDVLSQEDNTREKEKAHT